MTIRTKDMKYSIQNTIDLKENGTWGKFKMLLKVVVDREKNKINLDIEGHHYTNQPTLK